MRGQDTIDSRLQEALFKAGGVSYSNKDSLTKIGYSRCSRTDKGVHALTQIVSLKILMNELSTMGKRLNENLPPDIRVVGLPSPHIIIIIINVIILLRSIILFFIIIV